MAPDWSRLRIIVGGEPLTLETAEVLGHRRTLDLRRGVLVREWRLRAGGRTTRLRSLRFASLHDRHVLGQALELVAEDWSGPVTVEAVVDGDVTNENGVRHLVGHRTRPVDGGLLLETRTAGGHRRLPGHLDHPHRRRRRRGAGRGRGPASGRWCAATASRRRPGGRGGCRSW